MLLLEALIEAAKITPLRAIDIGSAFMGLTTGHAGIDPSQALPRTAPLQLRTMNTTATPEAPTAASPE